MFDIWYCPEFPVGAINCSDAIYRPDWDYYRPGLKEHMQANGMANPLIVLNHRDRSRYKDMWLKVGNNRMWAIKELGWTHVPVVITGPKPTQADAIKVEPEDLPKYFKDGYPVITEDSIKMAGYALPEEMEYPDVTDGYRPETPAS